MVSRFLAIALLLLSCARTHGQLCIWAEEFENSCTSGCYANTYSSPNGAWSVVNPGVNGNCANRFFVSCAENGNLVGACGTGCIVGANNETLHIGNELPGVCASPNGCLFCPTGDCGAAYDAGCPPALCAFCLCSCDDTETDRRAQSPVIDLTGYGPININLKYIENGQTNLDNASLWYFDSTIWTQLADLPKTGTCAGGQGIWTNFSVALPPSAWNNNNVRLGFHWVNNNDGAGADPSFAVDELQLIVPYAPTGEGLIVNEVSNGPSAAKEYIELLAVGPQCSTIDVRQIKVDDNNGTMYNGFGSALANSGVSTGHLRFSNAAQWATVPVGSLILLYNENDPNVLLPPDDPTDAAPNDSVYILPSNHALMQGCGTRPNAAVTSGYYNTCVFGAGNRNYLDLRNAGDAAQTRDPNGFYFHGVSWGTNTDNMNSGGLNNLRISPTDHTNKVIFFSDGNFRQAFNFTSAFTPGLQTPGAPNNALNAAYIAQLECEPLPVELLTFSARPLEDRVRLDWITATENNNAYFEVQRGTDGFGFHTIGIVNGAGNSLNEQYYVHDDIAPLPGLSYYRLRQVDYDGTASVSNTVAVHWNDLEGSTAWVDANGDLHIAASLGPGEWTLIDALGRRIAQGPLDMNGQALYRPQDRTVGILSVLITVGDRMRTMRVLLS